MLYHIDYTCNNVILPLYRSPKPWVIPLWIFLMHLEQLKWTPLPQYSTLGDIKDWSSFPSGFTLSIENGIYWLSLEPLFCAWPMGEWFPLVPGSLTDGLSVMLGTLYLTTWSFSEDWCPWTDGNSAPFNLPTIYSISLLKSVNRSLAIKPSSSNSGSSSWYNMNWILELLNGTSLI